MRLVRTRYDFMRNVADADIQPDATVFSVTIARSKCLLKDLLAVRSHIPQRVARNNFRRG
jgi:hypothetical protein